MHEIHPVVNAKQNIKLQMSYIDISVKLTCLQTNAHREFGFFASKQYVGHCSLLISGL